MRTPVTSNEIRQIAESASSGARLEADGVIREAPRGEREQLPVRQAVSTVREAPLGEIWD